MGFGGWIYAVRRDGTKLACIRQEITGGLSNILSGFPKGEKKNG